MSTLQPDRIRAAKLDAQILDLKRSLSTLQAERELVQERLDSHKYPVLTLPNEIVAEIFGRCLPNYPECPGSKDFSPNRLMYICRKWRDIALATPTLWRAIRICLGRRRKNPAARQVRKLETWLSRSGSCPMSVQITILEPPIDCNFSSAHCARWEVLKIFLPPSCLPITEAAMPLLRQLDLTITDDLVASNLIPFGEVPLLRSVILNDFAANSITLPWAQLTSLELHRVYPSECTPILQQTSQLIHCTLLLVEGDDSTFGNTTLPFLKSLVVLGNRRNSDYNTRVTGYIDSFIVPALHEIDILERFLKDPIISLESLVSKSRCQLQKVTIGGKRYVSSDAYRSALPSVDFSFTGEYFGEEPDAAP
ncbi:hypothetical protein C8F04DRAFT_1101739 [Mycena alexandri]|uniref:F-box domain-containing protein n=1 Tax=Mycena alexandri TaxID=1745969 RepID=A0AAD6SZ49_9AGAR|nr:hypothetical protein C8F04DRAFT_1101739 [Mycena alexandri]